MAKFDPVDERDRAGELDLGDRAARPEQRDVLLLEDRDQLAGVERERADDGDDALLGGLAAAVGVLVGVAPAVAEDDLERPPVDAAVGVDPLAVDAGGLVDVRVRRRSAS